MANIKWKHYINYAVILVIGVIFSILSLTGSLKLGTQILLEKVTISIILAVSLSMIVGFLGELSLGHAGFMCVGAYLGGKVATLIDLGGESHLTIILSILIGGILLGLIEAISVKIPLIAPYTDAIEFSMLIIILLVKPTGILGKMRREKV